MRLYILLGRFVDMLSDEPEQCIIRVVAWHALRAGAKMTGKTRYCTECGKDIGAGKFCPFCGAGRKGAPPEPLPPPVLSAPPGETVIKPAEKKNTVLWVVLAIVAVAVVAGAVVAAVMLTGSTVSITIKSPSNGSTVSGDPVKVKVTVSGKGVSKVDVFLDSEKRSTMDAEPFETELSAVGKGTHTLKAAAFDAGGAKVAEATTTFESQGAGKTGDEGNKGNDEQAAAYKANLSAKVSAAASLNGQITTMANRINSEINFNTRYVPAALADDIQALYTSALTLVADASTLTPPDKMKALQARFISLVEQLKVRADALRWGVQAVSSGSDYKSQFDRGGAAKASFDAAWPTFVNDCRSQGVQV
jgi:hypothetical protein